jgi:hypothetical protein
MLNIGPTQGTIDLGENLVPEKREQCLDSLTGFLRPSMVRTHVAAVKR